ncbi:MAG TPA: hypothetical protein VFQ53_34200 [Kofleriaceae bacterium]|nr:hypothetical protein [Kofleriaceae bacterium]
MAAERDTADDDPDAGSEDSDAYRALLHELVQLFTAKRYEELRDKAVEAATRYRTSADVRAYAAHAMRQLGALEEGYAWAAQAVALAPDNLFAINRTSLLANLTGRHDVAYEMALRVRDRDARLAIDATNIAVTIVNGIHAAAKLDRIADAVEQFSPVIARLDHVELHFNSACLYALAGDDRVWTYMAKSLVTGKPKEAFADHDFDRIRDEARFERLLAHDWELEAAASARAGARFRDELAAHDFLDPARLATIVATAADVDPVRHPELERAIDADLDAPDGYAVYADWLLAQDNPRGELLLASRRHEEAPNVDERMYAYVEWAALVHAHAARWFGGFASHLHQRAPTTWRHGFVERLGFDLGFATDVDTAALLRDTLALPVCRFVRGLSIGDIPGDDVMEYGPVVDVLRTVSVPHLRTLEIAPRRFQMSWTRLDATGLTARFPALEGLVLGAGELTLDTFDLPQLRWLVVPTGGLSAASLAYITSARWPMLEDLEIWFGSSEYGADDVTADRLGPILVGRAMPQLRRLALRNAEFTDALVEWLVDAPILPRLVELDLSMGTLTDAGATVLRTHRARFAHLKRLSVEDNALSPRMIAELPQALPNVVVGKQKRDRYVTVGE